MSRLKEHLPIRSPDELVIAKSTELDAVLLSLNGDFADIIAYPPTQFGGIVSNQLHDHPEIIPCLMRGFVRFLNQNSEREFYRGKLFIVELHRIRIR